MRSINQTLDHILEKISAGAEPYCLPHTVKRCIKPTLIIALRTYFSFGSNHGLLLWVFEPFAANTACMRNNPTHGWLDNQHSIHHCTVSRAPLRKRTSVTCYTTQNPALHKWKGCGNPILLPPPRCRGVIDEWIAAQRGHYGYQAIYELIHISRSIFCSASVGFIIGF